MKKNYLFIIAAVFAALAISCSKELEGPATQEPVTADPEEIAGEYTHFTATADIAKSALGTPVTGGYKVVWNKWNDGEKDVVDTVVVNGKKASEVTITGDGTGLNFKVADVTAPYCAVVAPTTQNSTTGLWGSFDADAKTMNVIARGPGGPQQYLDGTYDPNAIIMVAYSAENPSLSFKHYSAFLKITVDSNTHENKNIQWVYIRDGEGGYLAGTWKLDFSNPDNITLKPNNLTKPIAYYCGEEGVPTGTSMTIALPAYNYDKGLIITIKDVDGQFSSFKVDAADYSDKAGVIMTKTFTLDPKPGKIIIRNAKDWEDFVKFGKEMNDYDIYKWKGDGTTDNVVTIANDITFDVEPTRFTGLNSKGLQYDLDGGGHTLTFNCDRQYSLIRGLRGTVKNLTIAAENGHKIVGNNGAGSSFVDTLYTGGLIQNCVNAMPLEMSNEQKPLIIGGIVKANYGGNIEGCTNSGDISGQSKSTSYSIATNIIQVGGIVATVGSYSNLGFNDIVLKDCTNTGDINVIPVVDEEASDKGFMIFGVGGIAGWIRKGATSDNNTRTFENCNNEGDITVSGDMITSLTGLKAASVSVGGIAGIAANISTSNGLLNSPTETNGIRTVFTNCSNTGTIKNTVYNNSGENLKNLHGMVFTSGLIGSLMGQKAAYAKVYNCTNIGTILSNDKTGDGAPTNVHFCTVVSGLIGFCGYADINGCTVNCTIGNGKRGVASIGGISACVLRPVKVNECKVYYEGWFQRSARFRDNRALALVVPKTYTNREGKSAGFVPAADVAGSELKDCKLDWLLHTSSTQIDKTDDDNTQDWSSLLTTKFNYAGGTGFSKKQDFAIGNGYANPQASGSATAGDWTISGVSQWTDHPAVGTLQ